MSFNQKKSKLLFHTQIKKHLRLGSYAGIKICDKVKFLGYMLNSKLNNTDHVEYIQGKINKIKKMLWISTSNKLNKWRRLYIFK